MNIATNRGLLRRNAFGLAALAAFSTADAAPLAGQPVTDEILVPTGSGAVTPTGIAVSATGDFVVAWDDSDGSGTGVRARLFHADGTPATGDIAVNLTTFANQLLGRVAMDASGDFAVTWSSKAQDGGDYGVYARRFDATGAPVTGEIAVNQFTFGVQGPSFIGMDAVGNFVVAWSSALQDGSNEGVFARRFGADGTPADDEFPVNQFTTQRQAPTGLSMNATGGFVVIWDSAGQDGNGSGAYARRFAADGTPATDEIQISSVTSGNEAARAVAVDSQGNFVASWGNTEPRVFVRRFGADGTPIGTEVDLGNSSANPSLALGDSGQFVAAWTDSADIYYRRFAADNSGLGSLSVANAVTLGGQVAPKMAGDADGDFVIAWRDDGSSAMKARRFAGSENVDLALVLADAADPIVEGTALDYTATVSNLHPQVTPTGIAAFDGAIGSATGVRVTQELASGSTYNGFTGTGWSCSNAVLTVTCTLGRVLGAGTHDAVTLHATAPTGTSGAVSTASTSGQQFDSDEASPGTDNSTTESTSLGLPGDLDRDGVGDGIDNCPSQANGLQEDTDLDGVGDVCDTSPLGLCLGQVVTIRGNDDPDVLMGTAGDDVIDGRGGDDVIDGGAGGDTICGGEGNDDIRGGTGRDVLSSDGGDDTIRGGFGFNRLAGGAGNDHLIGGSDHEQMHGGPGNDVLDGNGGADDLFGDDGADVLNGGNGSDTCSGGSGRDLASSCETSSGVP